MMVMVGLQDLNSSLNSERALQRTGEWIGLLKQGRNNSGMSVYFDAVTAIR
jgi:hypothetical protein